MSTKYLGNVLLLKVESAPGSGTYNTVGDSVDHTFGVTNESVDVSTKDSNRWGEILAAGGRSATISMNCIVSDDANLEIMRVAWRDDVILNYTIEYGNSKTFVCAFHIESMEVSGGRNTAQTLSVSMTSSGAPSTFS